MRILGELEKCRLYIESHAVKNGIKKKGFPPGPCITISRETGTSAKLVCEELVSFFNEKETVKSSPDWTIFDKNLIEKVLDDHHLPNTLKDLMEEEKISFFSSMLNEMFSGLPGQWVLIHKTSETILRLASLGYSIIIGRGANVITSHLTNTFHVRLIAPLNERIKNFAGRYCIDYKSAQVIIEQHDLCRKKYLYSVFNRKIDDPFLYNLVINTKGMDSKQVASIIGSAVIHKFPKVVKKQTELNTV
jgi:Cytidylate kinase-like family